MWDPSTGTLQLDAIRRAAASLDFEATVIEVKEAAQLPQALARAKAAKADAALLLSSPLFGSIPAVSAQLTLDNRLPAISLFPEFARAGGLLAYGPDVPDLYRQAGVMAAKVLAGAAPATLPVDRPTRFQLVLNLKAARDLGSRSLPFSSCAPTR
jgi:putative ABC transport system substrate-binding protein